MSKIKNFVVRSYWVNREIYTEAVRIANDFGCKTPRGILLADTDSQKILLLVKIPAGFEFFVEEALKGYISEPPEEVTVERILFKLKGIEKKEDGKFILLGALLKKNLAGFLNKLGIGTEYLRTVNINQMFLSKVTHGEEQGHLLSIPIPKGVVTAFWFWWNPPFDLRKVDFNGLKPKRQEEEEKEEE